MKRHLPKYVVADKDRHGNVRLYFNDRKRGTGKIRLPDDPTSSAFARAYADALDGKRPAPEAPPRPAISRPGNGTLRWLVAEYLSSPRFNALAEETRKNRRLVLEAACRETVAPDHPMTFGEVAIRDVTPKAIRVLRDNKRDTPFAADNRMGALKLVFDWALDEEIEGVDRNPVRDVRRFNPKSDGHHTWTIDEVRQFEAKFPVGTTPRLAMALMLYTGQRKSDIVRMGPGMVRFYRDENGRTAECLEFVQHKNRRRAPKAMYLPILPELRDIIARSPTGSETFLVNAKGLPFSDNVFSHWFRRQCDAAGLPQCTAHGLRKAAASIAAENGATDRELMALFGWRTERQANTYTRAADQRRMASRSIRLIVANDPTVGAQSTAGGINRTKRQTKSTAG